MKQNLRAEALGAYASALADPNADWRAVAELLKAALPVPKQSSEAFGDYVIPNSTSSAKIVWPSPVIDVLFSDGQSVRASFATVAGEPLNVGRALRVAQAFYEARNKRTSPNVQAAAIEKEGKTLARAGADLNWELA